MKIQIISYNGESRTFAENTQLIFSTHKEPRSLDEFDINIIDLASEVLWKNCGNDYSSINSIADIRHLGTMIRNSNKSTTVINFPYNSTFSYNFAYGPGDRVQSYLKKRELKNCLFDVVEIISKLEPEVKNYSLLYENTVTELGEMQYSASFYFEQATEPLIKSKDSEKIVCLKASEKLLFATLHILESEAHLFTFLKECALIHDSEKYPKWLHEYCILDDKEQQDKIAESKAKIASAENVINIAEEKLKENLELKSILVTNGSDLVDSVFDILEQILETDLSDFKDDKNREDFLISIGNDLDFVGEIKGVGQNIKQTDVSQARTHRIGREERLEENGEHKEVKALLIINPLRAKPLHERESVPTRQIELADKDGTLILETKTLLYVYEQFSLGKLSVDNCRNMFRQEKGLLTQEKIVKYLK